MELDNYNIVKIKIRCIIYINDVVYFYVGLSTHMTIYKILTYSDFIGYLSEIKSKQLENFNWSSVQDMSCPNEHIGEIAYKKEDIPKRRYTLKLDYGDLIEKDIAFENLVSKLEKLFSGYYVYANSQDILDLDNSKILLKTNLEKLVRTNIWDSTNSIFKSSIYTIGLMEQILDNSLLKYNYVYTLCGYTTDKNIIYYNKLKTECEDINNSEIKSEEFKDKLKELIKYQNNKSFIYKLNTHITRNYLILVCRLTFKEVEDKE